MKKPCQKILQHPVLKKTIIDRLKLMSLSLGKFDEAIVWFPNTQMTKKTAEESSLQQSIQQNNCILKITVYYLMTTPFGTISTPGILPPGMFPIAVLKAAAVPKPASTVTSFPFEVNVYEMAYVPPQIVSTSLSLRWITLILVSPK